jgi:leucyl aminopeptidase
MKFLIGKGGYVKVLLAFKETESLAEASELFSFVKEKKLFAGKSGEIYTSLSLNGESFVLLGLGEEKKLDYQVLRKAFHSLGKEASKLKLESIGISIPKFGDRCYGKTMKAVAEGLIQSQYSFDKYKSKKDSTVVLDSVYLDTLPEKEEKVRSVIAETETLMEGVFLTRDLVNEPAIAMYPEVLAKSAVDALSPLGIEVTVYGREKIEELGMVAFLAVAKGSEREPQFIVMRYNGNPDSAEKLAFVGKGLTYDSGGYCLKPAESMGAMHTDMAGAASVIGAMHSIAKAGLKKNVVAIVAACENMISGGAYKTGDIISSMSGKTIEIGNTDAEGRVTLADALWYTATVEKADRIIDLATLTGACVVALGSVNTGAVSNDEDLMSRIKTAASLAGEPVWELPHDEEYLELFKSDFADLKNTGGRWAGAITAGLFLREFVNETPWVHLDIAGTSHLSSPMGYLPKGATGVSVKTLFNLVKDI